MKRLLGLLVLAVLSALPFAAPVEASPVSYAGQLHTSKLLPVTNVLILEQDPSGTVHGTVYGSEVSGNGQAVINHNPPFTPVRSLIVGITDGLTPEGAEKTQIIMFLNKSFAASIAGVKWSDVFPGSSHSGAVASLIAATTGDATALAWFTDTFFKTIAAPAVFDTGAEFVIGEFSSFDVIGGATTAGTWLLNAPIVLLAKGAPGTISGRPTAVVDESAPDTGPFDIQLQFAPDLANNTTAAGSFGVVKRVFNNTGRVWTQFTMDIGTGLGGAFVPRSLPTDPSFVDPTLATETTGAFPNVTFGAGTLIFTGQLNPGQTAVFSFLANTPNPESNNVTIRQSVVANARVAPAQSIPTLDAWAMIALMLSVGGMAVVRLRGARLPR
jgi:hypothetical protein